MAHLSDPGGADSNHGSAQTEGAPLEAARLQDATFLNAVLPFALSQARRHLEPLSIVCLSIDRLRGIQDLLGRAAVDRLVQNVGETVGSLIRGSDIVVRLDDDRVVAVLPRAPGKGDSTSPREYVAQSPRTRRPTARYLASRSRSAWLRSPLAPTMSYHYSARPTTHWSGLRAGAETRPPSLLRGRPSRGPSRTARLLRPVETRKVEIVISCPLKESKELEHTDETPRDQPIP